VTLTLEDLQNILRGVAQLAGCIVKQPWPAVAPNIVVIEGAINILGKPHFWETQIDLRDLKSGEDVGTLIARLLQAFDTAHGEVRK
jgi:hypothetical protein